MCNNTIFVNCMTVVRLGNHLLMPAMAGYIAVWHEQCAYVIQRCGLSLSPEASGCRSKKWCTKICPLTQLCDTWCQGLRVAEHWCAGLVMQVHGLKPS